MNIRQMREEKERMGTQIGLLDKQAEEMEGQIKE